MMLMPDTFEQSFGRIIKIIIIMSCSNKYKSRMIANNNNSKY